MRTNLSPSSTIPIRDACTLPVSPDTARPHASAAHRFATYRVKYVTPIKSPEPPKDKKKIYVLPHDENYYDNNMWRRLDSIADKLKSMDEGKILIISQAPIFREHATVQTNGIKEYLVGKGVDPDRLTVQVRNNISVFAVIHPVEISITKQRAPKPPTSQVAQ